MARRGRAVGTTSAARRREMLAALARSGLSIREFGRQHGIPAGTLAYWRHVEGPGAGRRRGPEPERAARARGRVHFVEVGPAPVVAPRDVSPPSGAGFELCLAGSRTVRIPADFDAAALTRLLRVLAPAC